MTKQNLIDLIQHRLSGGDTPQELKGKYHPRIIEKHCELALNYLVNTIAYKEAQRNMDWGVLDAYAKTYTDVEVLTDEIRNEKYSVLPSKYVALPKNRGIRMVAPIQGQDKPFVYRDNNTKWLYSSLDVNTVSADVRFYVEGEKIFYSEHIPNVITAVLIKMIVPFSDLGANDEVVIPQGFGKVVVDLVLQSMMGMPMEKVSNNNNANTP